MRVLDAGFAAHINDEHIVTFTLCQIDGAAVTYRFTNAPLDLLWGGFLWSHIDFELQELVIDPDGELATSLTFENVSQTIQTIALVEDFQERVLTVWEVWADASSAIYGQDLLIYGSTDGCKCSGWDTGNPVATIGVRSVHAISDNVAGPRQDYTVNCRYDEFKGPQCKYAGLVTACDRLYSTCLALGNTPNFGGFRYVLGPNETFTWGTVKGPIVMRPQPPLEPPPPPPVASQPDPPPRRRAVG